MGAGKRRSLHKYGIRPSAFAVSGVSMAFTPRWSFFTLVPITAVRASLLISLQNAFLRFERWRLSTHLPIHPPHWNKCVSISPHCAAPALYLSLSALRMKRRNEPRVRADSQAAREDGTLRVRLEDAARGISLKQDRGFETVRMQGRTFLIWKL